MADLDPKTIAAKTAMTREVASRSTDPDYYGALNFLPNPDPILRKLGASQQVYDALVMDSHVIGELRSIRSGLLGFEWRLQAGGDTPADIAAFELCLKVFNAAPAPDMTWPDTIWTMAHAVFRGLAVHEVIWQRSGNVVAPVAIKDRPQKRFVFSSDNELRLLTRENMTDGIELGPYKWLKTRHMPSYTNPYGVALLSSCFWPYTFKHSGFKFFAKFTEKFGMPWPVGKVPLGTSETDQQKFAQQLQALIEDAVAVIPDGNSVELLETSSTGTTPVHEKLINICNREMSKALTSQTLATEIQGQGSRAASETHRGREQQGQEADRNMIVATMNTLCRWITEINISGAKPPTFEFFEEAEARQEWADVFERVRGFVEVPARFAHERLQIPQAQDDEPILPSGGTSQPATEFSAGPCPDCGRQHDYRARERDALDDLRDRATAAADPEIETMWDQIRQMVVDFEKAGASMEELRDGIAELYPQFDNERLAQLTALALSEGYLFGMDEADAEA